MAGKYSKPWPRAGMGSAAPAEQLQLPRAGQATGGEASVGPSCPAQPLDTSEEWAGNSKISSKLASLSGCKTPACLAQSQKSELL